MFSGAKDVREIRTGRPNGGAECYWGRLKLANFNK